MTNTSDGVQELHCAFSSSAFGTIGTTVRGQKQKQPAQQLQEETKESSAVGSQFELGEYSSPAKAAKAHAGQRRPVPQQSVDGLVHSVHDSVPEQE